MAIDPDLAHIRKIIDALLRERRPDRYLIKDSTEEADDYAGELDVDDAAEDAQWLDEIAADVEELMPEHQVRRMLARKLVGQREGAATRTTNGLLRKVHRSGQLVLGWWDVNDDPVAVIVRINRPGERPRIRQERVAMRAMAPEDFRAFAIEDRRAAARDFAARSQAHAGAEWIADEMTAAGASRFETWARQVLPPEEPE